MGMLIDPRLDLAKIPLLPQRQDALNDQLKDLSAVAIQLGMYDADDFIKRHLMETTDHSAWLRTRAGSR